MDHRETIARLIRLAVEYDQGDPKRIQHFLKVHGFAAAIGVLEGLEEETLYILESAAVLHDIGIHVCEEKYGSEDGKLQELEGPAVAEVLLRRAGGFSEEEIQRIRYLIAHHHTYTNIRSMDYQILVEADFLVNLYENASGKEAIYSAGEKIFRTETGTLFLNIIFLNNNS